MLRVRRVNTTDAEDFAHTVLVRVMTRWDELQHRLDGGLLEYARWATLSVREHANRQSWRREPLEEHEWVFEDPATPADEFLVRTELWARRIAVIAELPLDFANVLTARVVRGLTIEAAAAELGVPVGTVKTRSRLAGEAWSALCRQRGL
jgi:RNA polymerase sigma factor (sigma-70 family)